MFDGQSTTETPFAVHCPKHGKVFLTESEYERQLVKPDDRWVCPVMDADPNEIGLCGRLAEFDDEQFEKTYGEQ